MKVGELNKTQKKRLFIPFIFYIVFALVMLGYFAFTLASENKHADDDWDSYLSDTQEQSALLEEVSQNAVVVETGTYVENLREINLKNSNYRVEFLVWFKWEGDADLDMAHNFRVYKGLINSKTVVKESYEDKVNYQLVSVDATVSKTYNTKRFPLESHQMRFYVESSYPAEQVVLMVDHENSGFNRNLTITGYDYLRSEIGQVSCVYDSTHGDPALSGREISSELVTMFEISRSNMGLYFKCFIALYGALLWSLIALFICGNHHVGPLGMMPGALFGAASNIMIGANLLPDTLELGLLEYVNIWGLVTILVTSIAIIAINRIRSKHGEHGFAKVYGRVAFAAITLFALLGQIIIPLSAYLK